jgi:flagellar biosynthetic protein FlhB
MDSALDILWILLPILLVCFVVAFLSNAVQIKWKVTSKPLEPKLSKLSPIAGFKRMFSVKQVVELLKSMGYPHPKGYVWYLKYNEIVPVVK